MMTFILEIVNKYEEFSSFLIYFLGINFRRLSNKKWLLARKLLFVLLLIN